MTTPDDARISHERSMAAFTDLNRMIERQQQNGQTTAQNGVQERR
jgi:hypothetical protein